MMEHYFPQLSEPARRWVRLTGLVAALALFAWLAYVLRAVFTPLFVALALAYVLNPVVTWCERVRRVPRLATVAVAFALLGVIIVGGGSYLGSRTVAQVQQLQQNIPKYVQNTGRWIAEYRARRLDVTGTAASTAVAERDADVATSGPSTAQSDDWWKLVAPLVQEHGITVARSVGNYLVGLVANVAGLAALLVLVPLYTFFFLWRFNDLVQLVHDHLPAAYRDTIVRVVRTIDCAIASFFRGRLIVCLLVGALLATGWSLVGVPYSVPLGLLAGVLNLVPFLSLLALPPALLCAYLGATEAGAPWTWPVLLTMGVYMAVHAIESFLLGPYVYGRSSGLHPLTIVVALLIGGHLAGLLGLLLAVPLASTLKTLAAEFVLPEIRRLASASDQSAGGGP